MSSETVEVKHLKLRRPSVIGLIIAAVFLGLWWGVPTFRKARADAMVRELCAKDGGIKVYDVVRLQSDRFGPNGNVTFSGNKNLPPLGKEANLTDDFYFTSETTWIVPDSGFGSLAVWRTHDKLFRAAGDMLLGESISYSRRGGDPIGPWHPSSFGCPSDSDIVYLLRRALIRN